MITVREWLALKSDQELTDKLVRSFGREVATAYRYDRIEPPSKYKKVCIYDRVRDNGIIEKAWIAFKKRLSL